MIQPRKRFGQHFLHDPAVLDHIISGISPKETDCMVEIGPGLGALTKRLLPLLKRLEVVELDRDLIPVLIADCHDLGNLVVHQADALKFDFSSLTKIPRSLRVVGNLPYNISTPLLFHLLDNASIIQDMHFMLQKEVVDRIVAKPDTSSYGRLSVMIQSRCEAISLFNVGRGAFTPPPKVESAVVRLIPYENAPFEIANPKLFEEIVRAAFGQRRKTLRNSLKAFVTPEQWTTLNIDPMSRAEQLSVEDFAVLSNVIQPSNV